MRHDTNSTGLWLSQGTKCDLLTPGISCLWQKYVNEYCSYGKSQQNHVRTVFIIVSDVTPDHIKAMKDINFFFKNNCRRHTWWVGNLTTWEENSSALFFFFGQECISNYLHLLILEERNCLHAGNNKSGILNIWISAVRKMSIKRQFPVGKILIESQALCRKCLGLRM